MMDGRYRGRAALAGFAVCVGNFFWNLSLLHVLMPSRAEGEAFSPEHLPITGAIGLLAAIGTAWAIVARQGWSGTGMWVPVVTLLVFSATAGLNLFLSLVIDALVGAALVSAGSVAVLAAYAIRRPASTPPPAAAFPANHAPPRADQGRPRTPGASWGAARDVPPTAGTADVPEKINRVVRDAVEAVAPALERRLRQFHGHSWLDVVNDRRARERRSPGRGLSDHRFCLAIIGYDDATLDWVSGGVRAAARKLLNLANRSAHNEPMTSQDLVTARSLAGTIRAAAR